MKCFTCDQCGGHFQTDWTEEEAQAEKEANGFGDTPKDQEARVCDDCYKAIMARHIQKP